ncbi:MAG: hypothetical protein ACI93V_000063, partial [Alteromonadaceae bacterium]
RKEHQKLPNFSWQEENWTILLKGYRDLANSTSV